MNNQCKRKQKIYYDGGSSVLALLKPRDAVGIPDGTCWALRAVETHEVSPQSYDVQTPEGHTF